METKQSMFEEPSRGSKHTIYLPCKRCGMLWNRIEDQSICSLKTVIRWITETLDINFFEKGPDFYFCPGCLSCWGGGGETLNEGAFTPGVRHTHKKASTPLQPVRAKNLSTGSRNFNCHEWRSYQHCRHLFTQKCSTLRNEWPPFQANCWKRITTHRANLVLTDKAKR